MEMEMKGRREGEDERIRGEERHRFDPDGAERCWKGMIYGFLLGRFVDWYHSFFFFLFCTYLVDVPGLSNLV